MIWTKEMKGLAGLLILLTLPTNAFCQINADELYGMTSEQNANWLETVSSADKEAQFALVKGRLFENRQTLNPADKLDVPVLIVDGIPIEDKIDDRRKEFLTTQLTQEKVDIKVVIQAPEGLHINRGFTGMVLIVIIDKKTSKKFMRLK